MYEDLEARELIRIWANKVCPLLFAEPDDYVWTELSSAYETLECWLCPQSKGRLTDRLVSREEFDLALAKAQEARSSAGKLGLERTWGDLRGIIERGELSRLAGSLEVYGIKMASGWAEHVMTVPALVGLVCLGARLKYLTPEQTAEIKGRRLNRLHAELAAMFPQLKARKHARTDRRGVDTDLSELGSIFRRYRPLPQRPHPGIAGNMTHLRFRPTSLRRHGQRNSTASTASESLP